MSHTVGGAPGETRVLGGSRGLVLSPGSLFLDGVKGMSVWGLLAWTLWNHFHVEHHHVYLGRRLCTPGPDGERLFQHRPPSRGQTPPGTGRRLTAAEFPYGESSVIFLHTRCHNSSFPSSVSSFACWLRCRLLRWQCTLTPFYYPGSDHAMALQLTLLVDRDSTDDLLRGTVTLLFSLQMEVHLVIICNHSRMVNFTVSWFLHLYGDYSNRC